MDEHCLISKSQCCPKDNDYELNLIYQVLSETNISPQITRERDVDISGCPVCLGKLEEEVSMSLIVLPCQH